MRGDRARFAGAALLLALGLAGVGCGRTAASPGEEMNRIAESYVRMVLALGLHDPDYVDAYLGPAAWREEAEAEALALDAIAARAGAALSELKAGSAGDDGAERRRHAHLVKSFESLLARIEILSGAEMSFDRESQALYDAVAPARGAESFESVLERLDRKLPGKGPVAKRFESFRDRFVIPAERLDAVFAAAIEACRERTAAHLELPDEESFDLEYVRDKSWSGYNWYQGDYRSLIQINTDLPIHADRALDLACHEGYPGHHVYNMLVERELVRRRGWIEFAVYPLFSPRSLIAEGSANFGIEVAFPAGERTEFERRRLFPLAGLDPEEAGLYYEVLEIARGLDFAGNEAARRYLDGEIDAAEAAAFLSKYALMSPARAEQRVRFIDQYRSYVINYNLGRDLVRSYIELRGGTPDRPERRWAEFAELLTTPILPSEMGGE